MTDPAASPPAPPPVHGGAETLEFIARHKESYTAEQLLWTLPNILPVLVFVALFVALAPLDRGLALLATVIGALSWGLVLAIPVTSRGSTVLVYLSDRYAAAADDGERLRYATAAEAVIAENNTPAVAGMLSALGILLISVVSSRGCCRACGSCGQGLRCCGWERTRAAALSGPEGPDGPGSRPGLRPPARGRPSAAAPTP